LTPAAGAIEPVRDPELTLPVDSLRRSEELAPRLRRVHRLYDLVNRVGSSRACPMLVAKGGGRVARLLAERVLPPLDEASILIPTSRGYRLCVSRRSGRYYYLQGTYEAGTLAAMGSFLRPGDVFVDVGASVGQMTMEASRLVGPSGTVLAFEPHGGRFAELVNTVAANEVHNVLCFPCGLGAEPGDVSLFTDRGSPSMVALPGSDRAESVPVVRLDDVLAAHSVGPVRMIKIDVEGFERQVLAGAPATLAAEVPPVLCLEQGVYDEPFLDLVLATGRYELLELARSKYFASPLRPIGAGGPRPEDNVFCVPR
jgi:FkbM family methyltransferase